MTATLVISERYILHEPVGQGSMGIVYRATDRLTGQIVALKRVTVDPVSLKLGSTSRGDDFTLALAREFQTLAALRHPHIISVLDYGFSSEHQPYLTMTLIENAQDIVQAAVGFSAFDKVNLLVQLLEALNYLHRRQVIHRDVKPKNVLVDQDGQVKVLDFGLAIQIGQGRESSGTLAYIAPEVMLGSDATPASDLYSVGLIAYELFAGRHPFAVDNFMTLLDQVARVKPDVSIVPETVGTWNDLPSPVVGPTLRAIVACLLEKDPARRYQDADSVIFDLCLLTGQPEPAENLQVRESFLQAAQFVGRATEMKTLMAGLDLATAGRGSAWLVGGESGVGKSRLLEELRRYALVQGMLVLDGQSMESGGLPYQLLRNPMRHLALMTPLTDLEASIFKDLVPDIDQILAREIPDTPEIDHVQYEQRLAMTLVDVLRRQPRPMLLLLEDLQWLVASLDLLNVLFRSIDDLPLLVIGSYRDDERPTLPQDLPGSHRLTLKRLTEAEIAALSASMLGHAGVDPAVLNILVTETEGNAFFIIEVVRALAEEAGRLSDIGKRTLPNRVFAGGISQVIGRRLARVPDWAQPLLALAAVIGRQIDLDLLGALEPDLDLEKWVLACADAAVLDVREGTWWFAHDKLREKLLSDLGDDRRHGLHRQAAEAIEAIHPDDESYALTLTDHWHAAGDPAKESYYAQMYGQYIERIGQLQRAEQYFNRALSLIAEHEQPRRAALLFRLGKTTEKLGILTQALHYFEAGLSLSGQDVRLRIEGLNGLSSVEGERGNYTHSMQHAVTAYTLATAIGDPHAIADSLDSMAWAAQHHGEHERAIVHLTASLSLYRELEDLRGIATALSKLGLAAVSLGNHDAARQYFEDCLKIRMENGDRYGAGTVLNNLGIIAFYHADYRQAQDYWTQNMVDHRALNDEVSMGYDLNNLGMVALVLGQYEQATEYLNQGYELFAESDNFTLKEIFLTSLAELAIEQNDFSTAYDRYTQSLALARQIDHNEFVVVSLVGFARVDLKTGNLDHAGQVLREALTLIQTSKYESILPETLIISAHLYLLKDQPIHSAELAGMAMAHPAFQPILRDTRLNPLLNMLQSRLTPADLDAAIARGKTRDLPVALTDLLASIH